MKSKTSLFLEKSLKFLNFNRMSKILIFSNLDYCNHQLSVRLISCIKIFSLQSFIFQFDEILQCLPFIFCLKFMLNFFLIPFNCTKIIASIWYKVTFLDFKKKSSWTLYWCYFFHFRILVRSNLLYIFIKLCFPDKFHSSQIHNCDDSII